MTYSGWLAPELFGPFFATPPQSVLPWLVEKLAVTRFMCLRS